MVLLPLVQQMGVDGPCVCGSNVATIGVVVTLMIDPTSSGVTGLVQLMLLLLMLISDDSVGVDHVVNHVALHVQSVVGITGA